MRALAGLARKLFENRRRETDHLHFVESAGRQSKQRAANAIALRILHLSHVAERHHGLYEMESRRVVQSNALAQFGQADAVAVPRDFFHDCESSRERLDADPLVPTYAANRSDAGRTSCPIRGSLSALRSQEVVSSAFRN